MPDLRKLAEWLPATIPLTLTLERVSSTVEDVPARPAEDGMPEEAAHRELIMVYRLDLGAFAVDPDHRYLTAEARVREDVLEGDEDASSDRRLQKLAELMARCVERDLLDYVAQGSAAERRRNARGEAAKRPMMSYRDQAPKDAALTAKARAKPKRKLTGAAADALVGRVLALGSPRMTGCGAAVQTTDELLAACQEVSFEPSCLDMGWKWEAVRIAAVGDSLHGWLIRCSFQRPDRLSGQIARGKGRWWFVEAGSSVSAVQKTMYAGAKMIVEHELMEAFKVKGARPFDPHRTIGQLTSVEDLLPR